MIAPELLQAAIATMQQRGKENGYDVGSERNAARVAAIFNAIKGEEVLSEADVWLVQICLKLARIETQAATGRGDIKDNITDLIAYAALRGETLVNQPRETAADAANRIFKGDAAVCLNGQPAHILREADPVERDDDDSLDPDREVGITPARQLRPVGRDEEDC